MKTYYSDFTADGAKGSAAFITSPSTTIVYLYRRSPTTLTGSDRPNGSVIYTFITGYTDISAVTNGWSVTVPSGTDTLYVTAATAYSDPSNPPETTTILSNQWGIPRGISQNNLSGTSSKTVYLFKRGTSSTPPSVPSVASTYTFSTDVLLGTSGAGNTVSPFLNGWEQQASTDKSQGIYTFLTYATVFGTSTTDTISSTEWATPVVLTIDGTDGIDAVSGMLTNEVFTTSTASDGTGYTLTGSGGTFKVYSGVTDVTTSCTFSVVAPATANGLTMSIVSNTGVYSLSGASWTSDSQNFTLRAIYGTTTIDKTYTISKVKTGVAGMSYSITPNVNAIKKNSAGTTITPTTITFSGTSSSGTGAPSAYSGRFIISTSTDGTTFTAQSTSTVNETSRTYTIPGTASYVRGILYQAGGTTVELDRQTVPVIIDGTDGVDGAAAVSGNLTNDSIGLPALANGTVTSFSTANGQFKVYSGGTDVTAVSTFGTPILVGCTGTVNTDVNTPVSGQPRGYYQVTAMSADTATMTMAATYAGVTITKIFSLSKSVKAYEILATFPTTNNFEGRLVYLTAVVSATGTFPLSSGPSPGGLYGQYPAKQQYKYTTDNGWIGTSAADQVLGTLSSAQIASLDTTKLTGTIGANLIAANAIVASKFLAVDTNNLITDPNFTDAGSSAVNNYWFISGFTVSTDPSSTFVSGLGSPSALLSPTGNGTTSQGTSEAYPAATRITVEPSKPYRFFVRARVGAGFTGRIGIVARWYKYDPVQSTPTLISSTVTPVNVIRATNPTTGTETGNFTSTANTSAQNLNIEGVITSPSDAYFVRVGLQVAWSTTIANAGACAYALPRVMRAMNAEMVVDGSITADKLTVTQLSAVSATVGTLTTRTTSTDSGMEISDNIIKIYDTGGTIRVKLGNLAL